MKSIVYLFLLFSFIGIMYAQLGEEAGPLVFNVTLGGKETLNYSILNNGDSPINFSVILPKLNSIPNNETPIVNVSPMYGVIGPHSQITMHVTVFMPSSDKPGLEWNGGFSSGTSGIIVVEGSPSITNSGMGAVVYAAVIKGLYIRSSEPKTNIVLIIVMLGIASFAAALLAMYFYYKSASKKREVSSKKKSLEIAEYKAKPKAKARKARKARAKATKGKKSKKKARK